MLVLMVLGRSFRNFRQMAVFIRWPLPVDPCHQQRKTTGSPTCGCMGSHPPLMLPVWPRNHKLFRTQSQCTLTIPQCARYWRHPAPLDGTLGSGHESTAVESIRIVYRTDANADALSHNPVGEVPEEGIGETEFQVATIMSDQSSKCPL